MHRTSQDAADKCRILSDTDSIEVTNPKSKSKGAKLLKIDGQKIAGNVIPFPTDGRTAVKVEVTLGA